LIENLKADGILDLPDRRGRRPRGSVTGQADPILGVPQGAVEGRVDTFSPVVLHRVEAPLLFLILNKYSNYLVYSVGVGVGIAVLFGMLRFLYSWSLKPFIYILVGILSAFSLWPLFQPNMNFLTGLAWDCGAATTGPATVPLVLAPGK